MENETVKNDNTEGIGADNEDILQAKRKTRTAASVSGASVYKPAVNAGTLKSQMKVSASAVPQKKAVPLAVKTVSPAVQIPSKAAVSGQTKSAALPVGNTVVSKPAGKTGAASAVQAVPPAQAAKSSTKTEAVVPSRPTAAKAAPEKKPAATPVLPAKSAVSAEKKNSADARPAVSKAAQEKKPAAVPVLPAKSAVSAEKKNSADARPAVSKAAPEKKSAAAPVLPAKSAVSAEKKNLAGTRPVSPANSQKSVAAMIPFQQSALPQKSPKKGTDNAPTRVTDVVSAKKNAAVSNAETRLADTVSSRNQQNVYTNDPEMRDESEAGNTIISIVKAITYIVAVLVVSVFLAVFIILVGNDIYAFVKDDASVTVSVPEYASLNDIAELLYENEIISYPNIFTFYATFKKDDCKFVKGEYEINGMMNYDELLLAFKEKKPTGTSRITIPEGYTTDEIIDLMVSHGIGTRDRYIDVINNYDFDYWFIDELEADGISEERFYRLDGYLFPDTYEFYNASTEEVVIGKLLKRFNQVFVESYAQKAEELGYTVDEILIIASMVEKEAGRLSEFFNVSSVFNNRLRNSRAFPYLESDATVVYAIHHETGERITPTGEDMRYESAYNTYTNPGFPPGPIANPSASAIRAALYPADTEYYFFYSPTPSITWFSATKEEHEANIERARNGDLSDPVTE